MPELVTAFGLMLIMEGCLYALFPAHLKRMIAEILMLKTDRIRFFGIVLLLVGFFIVSLVHGH